MALRIDISPWRTQGHLTDAVRRMEERMAAAQRPVPFVLRCVCLAGFPQASTYRVTIALRKAKKMGFGDYRGTVGKQSALWVRPGGKLIASGEEVDIGAILIESGTAVLEQPAGCAEEVLINWEVRIPRILVTENQ